MRTVHRFSPGLPVLAAILTLGLRPDTCIASTGAEVPFLTYEAEMAEQIQGLIVRMSAVPDANIFTPELEASGRAFVELHHTGDHVEFRVSQKANTLVLRHCIPDAPGGGGLESSLSLYINGRFVQKLALSSKFNWLYGPTGRNGQSNDPGAGSAHAFWDESAFALKSPVASGDRIRLQRDADDTAAYYRLDLVDLEESPPSLPPPDGEFLSVIDFGARGNGEADDTEAIQHCIDAAVIQGKTVWLPAGTYFQSARWTIEGARVQGAGMWHTHIVGTKHGATWGGELGFDLRGHGASVRDLSITSAVTTSRANGGGQAFTGNGSHWLAENIWISHTNTGFWMSGATHGVIRRCRVRFTYADGINLNNGASDNLVEHCYVRGTGDDSLAILSESRVPAVSQRNTLRRNTAVAPWWGSNCDLAGGSNHLIEDNLLSDSGHFGGLVVNLPSAYPMHPLTSTLMQRNVLQRCGGNYAGQHRGAIWIYAGSNAINHVTFLENQIIHPIFSAIHLHASWRAKMLSSSHEVSVEFIGNRILYPRSEAVLIEPNLTGRAVFQRNTLVDSTARKTPFRGISTQRFIIIQSGNTWSG